MVNRSICWTAIVWGGYILIEWLVKVAHQLPGAYSAAEVGYTTLGALMIAVGVYRLILGAKQSYSDDSF